MRSQGRSVFRSRAVLYVHGAGKHMGPTEPSAVGEAFQCGALLSGQVVQPTDVLVSTPPVFRSLTTSSTPAVKWPRNQSRPNPPVRESSEPSSVSVDELRKLL